jgi:hypothetical protein
MLTDIFSRRYEKRPLFTTVGQPELKFFVQAYRIINEQVIPYYGYDKKVDEKNKATWTWLQEQLSMELGVKELSAKYYSYQGEWMGKPHTYSGFYEINSVCESFLTQGYQDGWDQDVFVKIRLSFVELAFRTREAHISTANKSLPVTLQSAAWQDVKGKKNSFVLPGVAPKTYVEQAQASNDYLNAKFAADVHELNTRMLQAGMPLNYHSGYIQITHDALTQPQIEQPFWNLVKDAKWVNVSTDMAEAIDRRDTGGRDPAFYAGKALESTIKIICADKGWTTGNEKGASNFLDHLESKANGRFIEPWERSVMQAFFSGVRNDFGHGPGPAPMPVLTTEQTNSSIELSMSSIKSLINRL